MRVPRLLVFAKYWLPVLLWGWLIFTASGDSDSFNRSSRIIAPIVEWLFPSAREPTVDRIVFVTRKCAHVTEYAVLAWLLWRLLRQLLCGPDARWTWQPALLAFGGATAFAMTDEFHQTFVASRYGSWADVCLDSLGALLGIMFVWWIYGWRTARRRRAQDLLPQSE